MCIYVCAQMNLSVALFLQLVTKVQQNVFSRYLWKRLSQFLQKNGVLVLASMLDACACRLQVGGTRSRLQHSSATVGLKRVGCIVAGVKLFGLLQCHSFIAHLLPRPPPQAGTHSAPNHHHHHHHRHHHDPPLPRADARPHPTTPPPTKTVTRPAPSRACTITRELQPQTRINYRGARRDSQTTPVIQQVGVLNRRLKSGMPLVHNAACSAEDALLQAAAGESVSEANNNVRV
jgi:hypothetical protein